MVLKAGPLKPFLKDHKIQILFIKILGHCLFHYVDICIDRVKRMVDETAGPLA